MVILWFRGVKYVIPINNFESIYNQISHFQIGTQVNVTGLAAVTDAYGDATLFFNVDGSSCLTTTAFVTLNPFRWAPESYAADKLNNQDELTMDPGPVQNALQTDPYVSNPLLRHISHIYDMLPKGLSCTSAVTLNLTYTNEDLDWMDVTGSGFQQWEQGLVQQNLGLYKYCSVMAAGSASLTLVNPNPLPVNNNVEYRTTDLNSDYVLLPAKGPPKINSFFASPMVFAPSNSQIKTFPTIYWKTSDPTAPDTWVSIIITDSTGNTKVDTLTYSTNGAVPNQRYNFGEFGFKGFSPGYNWTEQPLAQLKIFQSWNGVTS